MTENEIIREIKKISLDDDHRFSFIAKYIVQNLSVVPESTIKEMAEYTYTSVATINRFTKYLNLDGYKELIHVVKYFNHNIKAEDDILKSADNNGFIYGIYHNIVRSLHDTFRLTLGHKEKISEIINKIKTARRINIFAVGGTYNVAKDFQEKILRLGFNAISVNDFHNGYFLAKNSTSEDLTIVVSYSGETQDLIKLARIAQENACPILLVCKKANNTISKIADYQITISSNESIERTISSTSRFALLFALDIIYYNLLSSDLEKYQTILDNTIINKF
ncbi:MurR/RpiR family transcriptional regulator [Spiroplasma eriocheiris]|uniref:GntR family transcriptional regulator n=1 Tax=Spiroplasma eriocheiris TaxID=315358 RepID=A0A0H3XJE3_9MOLU|nr:MurR/RpiR family transcriptional regulator [Spiroplasma eriocheiris]AHF57497.1 transcription regulator GntR [Spiroplasma eriocheiris CCTCC M 207170]AKM53956.1 GntR family transcriptional regulator [Spiroplasma eriocheiris]